ncbi:MAG: hypothetical protein ACI4QE_03485, partial [Acutalibacteraceae bacterium]
MYGTRFVGSLFSPNFCFESLPDANNFNLDLCYIIKIASNYYQILRLIKKIEFFNFVCRVAKIDIQN